MWHVSVAVAESQRKVAITSKIISLGSGEEDIAYLRVDTPLHDAPDLVFITRVDQREQVLTQPPQVVPRTEAAAVTPLAEGVDAELDALAAQRGLERSVGLHSGADVNATPVQRIQHRKAANGYVARAAHQQPRQQVFER
eukprot:6212420-Pleurochrysis_carterae.AAC.3